jgi:large subunit ribosomal protein L16
MLLYPKKVKHRRWQTGRKSEERLARSVETRGTKLQFGSFGLKAISPARITSRQIESARKVVTRGVGKTGKYWVRIFPDRPYTAKPAEVGMGKGKGNPEGFCFEVLPGRVLFEVDNLPAAEAREALRKAGSKLPVSTKIIIRDEIV